MKHRVLAKFFRARGLWGANLLSLSIMLLYCWYKAMSTYTEQKTVETRMWLLLIELVTCCTEGRAPTNCDIPAPHNQTASSSLSPPLSPSNLTLFVIAQPELTDITDYTINIIKILDQASSLGERVTPNKLLDAWKGKGQTSLRVRSVTPPKLSQDSCERLIVHLLFKGILKEEFHFTPYSTICYVVKGTRGDMVLRGLKVKMDIRDGDDDAVSLLLCMVLRDVKVKIDIKGADVDAVSVLLWYQGM